MSVQGAHFQKILIAFLDARPAVQLPCGKQNWDYTTIYEDMTQRQGCPTLMHILLGDTGNCTSLPYLNYLIYKNV